MSRILRFIGIIFFACLIGVSANALKSMYESGQLFETYNSSRKANITLLCVSLFAMTTLMDFELVRARRRMKKRRFGEVRHQPEDIEIAGGPANIYSAPQVWDEWKAPRSRSARSREQPTLDMTPIWQTTLRICCLTMPFLYILLYLQYTMRIEDAAQYRWLEIGILSSLLLFSAATNVGIYRQRPWGFICGYVMAVFSLLLFPFGTGVGLIMFLSLAGVTPLYVTAKQDSEKAKRRMKAKKRLQAPVT